MATMQQKLTLRSGSNASLVAARPIAQHFCFQPVVRQVAQQHSCQARRVPKAVAAAPALDTFSPSADLEMPAGWHLYETVMILKSTLSDEERDRELAKFEAYLNKQECQDINATVKGRHALAYPIKDMSEGIFVLYTYKARRQTARAVQLLLSNPEAGNEDTVVRHLTRFLA